MNMIRSVFDAILYPFRMLARIPSHVISSPRRMMGLSLPARAALLLFLGLVIIAIVWAIQRSGLEDRTQFSQFLRWELPAIIALVITIPLIVWYALKLWLEGPPSPFPDIDKAWQGALETMREQAIDPSETPIFMVLGPGTADAANHFMTASNVTFPVRTPVGPGPINVYANPTGIYIVCTDCCQLGRMLGATPSAPSAMNAPAQPAFDHTRTMEIGGGFSADPTNALGGPPAGIPGATAQTPFPLPDTNNDIRGTMMIGDMGPPNAATPASPPGPESPRLETGEAADATARLAYLCQLIRRLRDPLCPINGVLVSTPFGLLADGTQDAVNQLLTAIKADVSCLRRSLRLRCSVTHLIDGMEKEAGFQELIRRIGGERASTQRFGKGFGLWNPPTASQMDALVKHACGAFEDWSYLLFREADGLSKPGNRHLYALLCRIRSNFRGRLAHLIQSAYSYDQHSTNLANREPLLFSGCYFIANGVSPDRQAFLASVFRKTNAEEEDLEWGSEATNEEVRMQSGVQVLLVINGILVAAIVAMIIFYFQKDA